MVRPKTFDPSEALDTVVDALWQGGLHATSIDELLRATGLARSSFYNTFGSKAEVVRLAIDRYTGRQLTELEQAFDGRSLQAALEHILLTIAIDNYGGRGCLLVNSVSALRDADADTLVLIRDSFSAVAARLASLVAIASPELERPVLVATEIIGAIAGMRTLQRSGLPVAAVEETARRLALYISAA